jgi:uncharacterized protein YdiU (UPF0061 family)
MYINIESNYCAAPCHEALGEDFFDIVEPAIFPMQTLRYRNQRWAERIGLNSLDEAAWLRYFSGFEPLPDNIKQPLSLRYHGHQFRSYNPNIGDGRGFLFAQFRDLEDNRLLDLGTKGSGKTPWSRDGDGRLTLKGGVREVLATAMLEALGVYTSKSFSLIETGEDLHRGDEPSPTRSSVLVRLSHSHIRFGSFQRQAYMKKPDNIQKLLHYSIEYYFPHLQALEGDARTGAFLTEIVKESANLAASWMAAGFVHGVLNTDNMNITGESFDYGPYRFLPTLDPHFTAAYFDHTGLYAYGRQPECVAWNLERLADTLLLICDRETLVNSLKIYVEEFETRYVDHTLTRLGLQPNKEGSGRKEEMEFINAIYQFMYNSKVGFEQFFFDWYGGLASYDRAQESPDAEKYTIYEFTKLQTKFKNYRATNPERLSHNYFKNNRPCTLLIDEIETIWSHIADNDDWTAFDAKLEEIEDMRQALQP